MKLKHILPALAAVLAALLCGCETDLPEAPPESDPLPVTENTAPPESETETEDTAPPESETETHIHAFTETVTPPACESEGYTSLSCACGYTYDTNHTPPTGHTYEKTVIPPACETEGYTHYACVCGFTYESDREKPTGHTLQKTVIPPACETEGYTRFSCDCGYTYDTDHIPPTGHTLTQTVVEPTCETEGYTRLTCPCGYTYNTGHVPPTGHVLTETVVPPTCTESGCTSHQCAVCDYGYTTHPTSPLNHANATAKRFYPTPSRDGYTLHTCPDCGEVFKDSYVRYADIVTGAYVDSTDVLMQGIDTSKWNHEFGVSLEDPKSLDWAALKAAGVDFVILKAGSSNGIDPVFELDYRDAKAAGLQVGAYFYAYSTTVEDTLADAEMLLSWLEGKQFELPVYFDMEETSMMSLGGELLTELCRVFINRLQEAGYYAALYTNTEWLYNLLDTDWVKEHLDVWYARYTVSLPEGQEGFALTDTEFPGKDGPAYKPGETDRRFGMWQYTDSGVVEGFCYKFDFNYAFKDYGSIMAQWGLNGYGMPNSRPEPSIV